MPRRRLFRALALVDGGRCDGGRAGAIAATSAPNKATLHTVGRVTFKINEYIQDARASTRAPCGSSPAGR